MSRRAPRPVSQALEGLVGRLAPKTTLTELQRIWPQTVGDAIAAEATPVSERNGTVTVACSSAAWAAELKMIEGDLLERLSDALHDDVGLVGLRWVTRN